jgi:hypothetical protein
MTTSDVLIIHRSAFLNRDQYPEHLNVESYLVVHFPPLLKLSAFLLITIFQIQIKLNRNKSNQIKPFLSFVIWTYVIYSFRVHFFK